MGFQPTNPSTAKDMYTFEMGHLIEEMITDLCKMAGIYNNNSIKFWEKTTSVSGEIDIVVEIPLSEDEIIFVEAKSTWGAMSKARDLFDHYKGRGKDKKFYKAKPKMGNLFQLIIYLFEHKDDPKVIGGKLVYFFKDNSMRTEFDVHLEYNSAADKHVVFVNGVAEKGYYAEGIYERYQELLGKLREDFALISTGKTKEDLIPPERDYEVEYSREKAEEEYLAGRLAKSKFDKYDKEKPGAWMCAYCAYANLCLGKDISQLPEDLESEEAA